jgi:hypothetical protein
MDSLQETIRESAFVTCGLIIPQVLGFAAYRFLRRTRKSLVVLSALLPPISFYIIAYLYWAAAARAVRSEEHYVCGAFGAAASLSTVFGTLIHLSLAIMGLLTMSVITRIRVSKVAKEPAL